ncbi:hypothetical protein SAMN02927924_03927 [Sphingobium faniae]|nr:hypothetical protein SAMN02927924_03927 [Sphingobium faniae]
MSFFATMQRVPRNMLMLVLGLLALSFCFGFDAFAHNVAEGDKGYMAQSHPGSR